MLGTWLDYRNTVIKQDMSPYPLMWRELSKQTTRALCARDCLFVSVSALETWKRGPWVDGTAERAS